MDTGKMDGFDALFYAAVFDRLQTNIYILDVDTDTIVYMLSLIHISCPRKPQILTPVSEDWIDREEK